MRIKNKKQAVLSCLKIKFLGRRIPLAVRWQLTNRCILKCKYCNVWQTPEEEMSLGQITSLLDEMAAMGTQTISYSGGEPMLRKDIGTILEETAARGISTEMNSTGALVPERMSELEHLDFLKISLDGPEDIHDAVRGKNAFRIAMAAADACLTKGKKFIFCSTLTRFNITETAYLLEIAKRYRTLVAFQPLKSLYRGVKDVQDLEPGVQEYRAAVNFLIEETRKGNPHLRNSLIGLRHILQWPRYPRLRCLAGRIFCILNTNGMLMPCDRIAFPGPLPNCKESGFQNAFRALPGIRCGGCGFCGPLELNFLLSFRLGTLKSIMHVLR
jgi:MoaA/NifB/PqqE/SkfB family radical SAM enzyme